VSAKEIYDSLSHKITNHFSHDKILLQAMDDGGVDRTVIDCRRTSWAKWHFPPLLTFLIFDR
jgi:hypothetical protein